MSVVTPDLAEKWSTGQRRAFLHRMNGGLRAVLALIIPSAVGILLLSRPAVALLLGVGHSTPSQTTTTGAALAMFALGLPGFSAYLYMVRVLQSMQRTKVAFYLYLVENAFNITLAIVLVRPLGVRGLALSLSISYTVAAVLALVVLRQWFGRLADPETWSPLRRVVLASIPMGIVVLLVSNVSASTTTLALLLRVGGAVVAGVLTFGAAVTWLGRRHQRPRRPATPPTGIGPRPGLLGPFPPVGTAAGASSSGTTGGDASDGAAGDAAAAPRTTGVRRHRRRADPGGPAGDARTGGVGPPAHHLPRRGHARDQARTTAPTPARTRWPPGSRRGRRPGATRRPICGRLSTGVSGPVTTRTGVADSTGARRPHHHRQRVRHERPARQGAQRHRGAADHTLRLRGVGRPRPARRRRILGAL